MRPISNFLYFICIVTFFNGCNTQKLSKRKIKDLADFSKNQIEDSIILNPPYFTEPTSNSNKSNYVNINCLYATDRDIHLKNARPVFGTERSEIHYGNCNVSIPKTHKVGEVESASLLKFEFNEDPNKHISVINISSFKKEVFFAELQKRTNSSKLNNAFIFIHGYNVSFELASKTTAQLYYDYGFKGVPIFYSWPSQNSLLKYPVDENNSEWSTANFKSFLNDFLLDSKASNIYLIAHSMGNRLLVSALSSLIKENKIDKNRIKEIILVAPDIDVSIFKRDYAPILISAGIPITLYISSSDNALLLSKVFHGYKRVGDAVKSPNIFKGIETIDVTKANTDILGHSYFNNSRSVVDDIYYLINNQLRADQRRLLKRTINTGTYWEFIP